MPRASSLVIGHSSSDIPRRRARSGGFALLITITLLAFLVLLLVSLAALTRVETQVASNNQHIAQARQNALFALNIALGQLQKAAGPDQRVTARAELDPAAVLTNRRWTGVWDSDPASATYGQRLSWLVSGTTPNAATAVTDPGSTGVSTTAVRLVGAHSTDLSDAAASDTNRVDVSTQEIRTDSVLGLATTPGGHLVGRYGWWVGDEGVKARANLTNPLRAPWFTPAGAKLAPDRADLLNDIGLAQRNAIEWMRAATTGSDLLEPLLPAVTQPDFGSWLTRDQLPLASSDPAATTALTAATRARFHDLTFWSAGVQADVRKGGLKRDLTAAFELDDTAFQSSALANAANATDRTVMAPGFTATRFVSSIYNETLPATPPAAAPILRGPTWHLLRSHYRLYKQPTSLTATPTFGARALLPSSSGAQAPNDRLPIPAVDLFNGSGVTGDPKSADVVAKYGNNVTPRPTRSALLPYINRITFVISLETAALNPSDYPVGADGSAGGIYEVRLVLTPIIVLHNPHNVRLELRDLDGDGFWGRLLARGLPFGQIIRANGTREFTARTGATLENRVVNLGAAAEAATNRAMSYNNMMRFQVPAMTMEPGEVRVFSPNLTNTVQIGLNMPLGANKFVESGYYLNQLNGQRFDYFGGPNGPTTRQPWPIGPGGSNVAQTDATDHRVLVTGATPLDAAITTTQTGDGSMIVRFNVESDSGDSTLNSGDHLSLFSELHVNKPALGGSSADIAERVYASYATGTTNNSRFCGGQTAANYAGDPVPIFAYDLYVKTPDSNTAKAARPFITSNPLAMVTERDALGSFSGLGNRRGFPMTASSVQPAYRWFAGGGNWTTDILDADPDGFAYWGPSVTAATGLPNVSFIEVPVRPLSSIAQFQHLMISLYSHEPYFAIGNSEASPFIPTTARYYNALKGGAPWYFGDTSYLANEALWDSSFFSTLSPGFNGTTYYAGTDATNADSRESVRDAWLAGTRPLLNTRVQPYRSPAVTDAVRQTALLDPVRSAAHLLMEGAFNINSRSIDAWVAVLAGARDAAVPRTDGTTTSVTNAVAIPRTQISAGNERTASASDTWNGFTRLTDTQIRTLATQLVSQITQRQAANGNRPYLSLAEFINRALASTVLGQRGALQAAIDASGLNSSITGTAVDATSQVNFPVAGNGLGSSASVASGNLLQADLLQQIGPFLSARSDTFTIRTYGEALNPVTGAAEGRAWCEAVVQRVPDFVGGEPAETALASLTPGSASALFGRRFKVTSFRWLSPADL